jgi:TonB family protein
MLGSTRPSTGAAAVIDANGGVGLGRALSADARNPGSEPRNQPISALVISACLASVGHIALLVAMTLRPDERLIGAGGHHLDAISIEVSLVAATVMESRQAIVSDAGKVAVGEVAQTDGMPVRVASASAAPAPDNPPNPDRKTPEPVLATVTLDAADVTDQRLDTPVAETVQEPASKPAPAAPKQTQPEASIAAVSVPEGGAAGLVVVDRQAASHGAAAASPGAVQVYAKSVVEALGKNRPKSAQAGARGIVKIAFAVDDDGALAFARVAKTSGDQKLDGAALDAVKRIKLPAPPAGMTASQRTYEIPYNFR